MSSEPLHTRHKLKSVSDHNISTLKTSKFVTQKKRKRQHERTKESQSKTFSSSNRVGFFSHPPFDDTSIQLSMIYRFLKRWIRIISSFVESMEWALLGHTAAEPCTVFHLLARVLFRKSEEWRWILLYSVLCYFRSFLFRQIRLFTIL